MPSKEIDIRRERRGATLERVAGWDQHRGLSGTARRQVLGAMILLEQDPDERQTDKLLEVVGDRHKSALKKVLPKADVTEVIGERPDRYTVEDLIAEFGIDPVYTAFEYAHATAAYTEETEAKDERQYDPKTILGATKLSATYGLATAEQLYDAIEKFAADQELDHYKSFAALLQLSPDEAEQYLGHTLA